MRKRAAEKLRETKRRNSTEDEENSDSTTPKKKTSHTSVTELLQRNIQRKASEQAEQQLNKKRELELCASKTISSNAASATARNEYGYVKYTC